MIRRETAYAIACAYAEIEAGEKLLAKVEEVVRRGDTPDIRDAFGRQARGLQLGIPSGDNATRMVDVQWSLAAPVIRAHIAQQRAKLALLNEQVRSELDAPPTPTAAQEG